MYLLNFVNLVRNAQGFESLERMPACDDPSVSQLELAMGCHLEEGMMRLSSLEAAESVAGATGLPIGLDRMTIALPQALVPVARGLQAARLMHNRAAVGAAL